MKRIMLSLTALLLGAGLLIGEAEAKKLGGGKSFGAQRNVTAPPASTPPARQAQQAAPAQSPAAQPASGLSKWAPMLGGLAIGGMLGALFAGQGFGGALGSILMIALLAFAAVVLVRMFMRSRQPAAAALGAGSMQRAQPMQYQGLGNETVAAPPPSQAAGFDAQPAPVPTNVPAGFDVAGFVRQAKLSYIRLQGANDAGNLDEIRDFTTPEMFATLKADIEDRAGSRQTTDVVTLNADLLEVVTEGDRHWASVRFAGMVSEAPGQAPVGFEEIWNLSKPVDGSSGWVLSGIQQMH